MDGQVKNTARDGATSSSRPHVILFLLHCDSAQSFISGLLESLTPIYLKYIVLLDRSTVQAAL